MYALDWVLQRAWAIVPEQFDAITAIAGREGIEEKALQVLEARQGRPLDNTRKVTVREGVAVVPVRGVLSRHANMFTEICNDGTSLDVLATDFNAALDDPAVRAIVLEVDSPGGDANGIGEMATMIDRAKGRKPVWGYISNSAASGGYWLVSPAERIVMAPAAYAGSIGVVMGVRPDKGSGRVEIVSSNATRKRPDVTTESGRAQYQERVDDLERVFIDDVARYRDTTTEKVISDFGKGGVLIAANAIKAGMADSLGTLEDVIAELAQTGGEASRARGPGRLAASTQKGKIMAGENPKTPTAQVTDAEPETLDIENHPSMVAMRKEVERIRKENEETIAKAIGTEADAFVAQMVTAARILPSETGPIRALFVQAASDDRISPVKLKFAVGEKVQEGGRVDILKATIAGRQPHTLFAERTIAQARHDIPGFDVLAHDGQDQKTKLEALDDAAAKYAKRNGIAKK